MHHSYTYTRLHLLIALLFCLSMKLSAQNCIVTGNIKSKENQPISYASIIVEQDGKTITGTMSGEDGKFSISLPQSPQSYQVHITSIGYTNKSLDFTAFTEKIQLDNIFLERNAQLLGEVSISSQSSSKEINVEHTSLNPQSYMAEMKGSVADILRSSAAVSIDPNGKISVRGKQNVLLLLDGVPTTIEELSSISSTNIKSIDIITNPDASYDAEGTGGIINIVSQKVKGKGLSGQISANYGFNHFVNGNISLHYVAKGYSLRFSYQTKYEDDIIHGNLYRHLIQSNNSINQEVYSRRTIFNNNINIGGSFNINARNKLQADLRLNIPRLNNKQEFDNEYVIAGIHSHEKRYRNVSWNRENIEGVLSYQHIITPKKLSFTIRSSISKIWGHRPSYYFLEGDSVSKSVSGGSPLLTAHQIDFRINKKYGTWETGVKFSYRQNKIYHDFYNKEMEEWNFESQYSKDLFHQEYIPAAYMQFSTPKGKKLFGKAGIRIEYTLEKLKSQRDNVNQQYQHLFIAPQFMGLYKITDKQSISLAYSQRISRPSYPQLNPYMSMLDAKTFEQGNMYLHPETSHQVEFNYNLDTKIVKLNTNVYFNYTRNFITQVAMLQDDILLLTYVNGLSELKTGIDINLGIQAAKWLDINLSSNSYYVNSSGEYEHIDLANRGIVNQSNIQLDFKPIKGMKIQVQYFISSPDYLPQFTVPFSHELNIGISQHFLKNNLSISLLLTDVFKTNDWTVLSENKIYNLHNKSWNKSRMLWIGIRYNFNSYKGGRPNKQAEVDRSRVRIGQ